MKSNSKILLVLLSFALVFSFSANVYAQSNEKSTNIKMTVEEIFYMANLLQRIEISGNEVTPFLSIFDKLKKETQKAVKEKMKAGDNLSIEFNLTELRNFLLFMQRTKISGREAVKFKEVAEKVIAGIKKIS